jgi:hypothetical protein
MIQSVPIVFNEKRIGQYGNNVTRLLYSITVANNQVLDNNAYSSPTNALIVRTYKLALSVSSGLNATYFFNIQGGIVECKLQCL